MGIGLRMRFFFLLASLCLYSSFSVYGQSKLEGVYRVGGKVKSYHYLPRPQEPDYGLPAAEEGMTERELLRANLDRLSERLKPLEIPREVIPAELDKQSLSNVLKALVDDADRGGWFSALTGSSANLVGGGEGRGQRWEPVLWVVLDSGVYELRESGWSLNLVAQGNHLQAVGMTDSALRDAGLYIVGGRQMTSTEDVSRFSSTGYSDERQGRNREGQDESGVDPFPMDGKRILAAFRGYDFVDRWQENVNRLREEHERRMHAEKAGQSKKTKKK